MRHCLSHGWNAYRSNAMKAAVPSVFLFSCGLTKWYWDGFIHGSLVYKILWMLFGPVLTAGYAFYCLKLVRGDKPTIRDFAAGILHFGSVWLTTLIFNIIVSIGLLLFLVPGVIWLLKYGMSMISVLDKRVSPLEAIRFSGRITSGYKWKLLLLHSAILALIPLQLPFYYGLSLRLNWVSLFMVVSLICYLFVVLVLAPLAGLVLTSAYEKLSKKYEDENRPDVTFE